MIAALYVQRGGAYYGIPDVDPWDEERDARTYVGSDPVVAHPPCARWCRLAGLVQARWGHTRGEDGGCFAAALAAVRRCGGVLEHPAYSAAWPTFDLLPPVTGGGWTVADFQGGWTCYVEQRRYGHRAKKATWLYAVGVRLPSLRWGISPDASADALVSWCGNRVASGERRPRVGRRAAAATPPEFRDELLAMARSVRLATVVAALALAGCSSPAFDVGAPADVVDAAPEVVDGAGVDARTDAADVVDARADGCHVPEGAGWCSSALGSCEFDPASGSCWLRPGWLNSVPSCGATGFALMACTANADPSGEPCLPALLARVQSCGAIP